MTAPRPTYRLLLACLCAQAPERASAGQESPPSPPVSAAPAALAEDPLGGLRITLFGNLLGRRDDTALLDSEGRNLDDRVYLRSLAARFAAPIADLGRGLALGRWSEGADGDFETQIDEAYFESEPLRLPWEALSERLILRAGRFRAPFGRVNRWHVHELPQITRPLPIREMLGENGLVQSGLAGVLDLPTGSERVDFRLTAALARDYPLDEALTPFLNFALGLEAGRRDRLELGLSLDSSRNERDFGFQSSLRGVDLLYQHRPASAHDAGTFYLGAEALDSEVSLATETIQPAGYYVWSQLEVWPRLWMGARYDRSDDVADDALVSRVLGGYLGWVAHPRLRLGLGYEHTRSDDPALDGLDTLLLELNFVFGSSAPGPSWLEPGGQAPRSTAW